MDKCVCCGGIATIKATNPYFDELPELLGEDEVNEEDWWCEDCYQERMDDI